MLEGREQTPLGMSTSAGPGEASLRDCPRGPALPLPSWLLGRAGGLGEEGGIAGTGVPAGAHCPAWAPLAEGRRGPAPGWSGSSCLPLPPLSAPRRPPRQALCYAAGGLLCSHPAPSSRGPAACLRTWRTSTVSVWRVPVPAAPGVSSKCSSADSEGEAGRGRGRSQRRLSLQHRPSAPRPGAPLLPRQPRTSPVPPLPSPHLTRSH